MLPQCATDPQLPDRPFVPIGVGIDTSRYGHYAALLREDLNAAAAELGIGGWAAATAGTLE